MPSTLKTQLSASMKIIQSASPDKGLSLIHI
jgi:hypothetical protein